MAVPSSGSNEGAMLCRGALAETLAALVQINSVNPAHGGPAGGERAAMEWVVAWLAGHGVAASIIERSPGKPIMRARIEGERDGAPLLFETHMDTVSTAGMTIDPFGGAIDNGKLFGRGSTDAKGQAAAMLHAFGALARAEQRPARAIELCFVCDEEFGFSGAKGLIAEKPKVAGIVIGEPTGLRVVATHKGAVRFAVVVEGRLAHAARPSLGINAISAAAVLIDEINTRLMGQIAKQTAPLLAPATLNIAMIEGGQQPNLVPDRCKIDLERRLLPGETGADARREIEDLFKYAAARFDGFRAHLDPSWLEVDAFATDVESPLVRAAGRAAKGVGVPGEPIGVDYCTDASTLTALGVPMIVAGPGSIDQAHTEDEFISLDELERGGRFYYELMRWDGA